MTAVIQSLKYLIKCKCNFEEETTFHLQTYTLVTPSVFTLSANCACGWREAAAESMTKPTSLLFNNSWVGVCNLDMKERKKKNLHQITFSEICQSWSVYVRNQSNQLIPVVSQSAEGSGMTTSPSWWTVRRFHWWQNYQSGALVNPTSSYCQSSTWSTQ